VRPKINTPVEGYEIGNILILVKREDLAVDPPAPPFSKVRGLYTYLLKLKSQGIAVVGYVETSISMAGWGVAWACAEIGMKAVLYDPQYKETPPLLKYPRKQWEKFHPDIHPLPAGRARVNYYMGKRHLFATYGTNAVMLGLGLPLEETIEETAEEWRRTMRGLAEELLPLPKTTIVNVGSGTICAGLIRGWMPEEGTIIGVMGRSGRKKRKWNTIQEKSKRSLKQPGRIFGVPFRLEDPGWEYTEKSLCKCFFPCHPYYDRKAWQWLVEHIEELPQPILFWNIGRMNT